MKSDYRIELKKEIQRRLIERQYNLTDGALFLLSERNCPNCAELKRRDGVQNLIKTGKLTILEENSDLKRYLESELSVLSYPTFVRYSTENGFYIEDMWTEEQIIPLEEQELDIAIVINSSLKSIFADLLNDYINNGAVKLITKRELPIELRDQAEPPAGYVDGKLYPVIVEENAIIIARGEDGDDIEFEINE